MKTLAALLLTVCTLAAQSLSDPAFVASLTVPASGTSETLIKLETFEATGYDAGNTWTEAGSATPDEDYAGASLIDGSQSLQINVTAQTSSTELTYTLAQADQYFFCKVRKVGGTSNPLIVTLRNGTTSLAIISLTSSDTVTVTASGGTADATTDTFADGTVIYLWLHFTQGSGANAAIRAWASTTGTKPADGGTGYAESLDGTTTAQGNRFRLGFTASSTCEVIFDTVKIDDVPLGNQ